MHVRSVEKKTWKTQRGARKIKLNSQSDTKKKYIAGIPTRDRIAQHFTNIAVK